MSNPIPLLAPVYLPGQEPLPPGVAPEEIDAWRQAQVYQKYMGYIPESCPFKVVLAGGGGFVLGGFFSLMSATFAYEDPLTRASTVMANKGTKAQTMYVMKEMGRNMYQSGRGFAKVGMLFSGFECAIEGVSLLTESRERKLTIEV
jgi:import inner membrane translocase subunit TIM22